MNSKDLARVALSAAVAAGFGLGSAASAEAKPKWKGHEKCAGISKAGKNDCGTSKHACAGMAKKDNDSKEWIYLPKGTCEKIAGGRVIVSSEKKKS